MTMWAFLFLSLSLPATLAAQDRAIPLLISEHHADHLDFFQRFVHRRDNSGRDASFTLLVLDAHADTTANENPQSAGNHSWIHPLNPNTLVWISTINEAPRRDKLAGFYSSVAQWNRMTRALALSLRELRYFELYAQAGEKTPGETLFVSVDLDFFYSEDHRPQDVKPVLDELFAFSSRWPGRLVWAFCLSRPWLPDDRYAWALLEQSLGWLASRPEFAPPVIGLFDSSRIDTSLNARAFRAEGRQIPVLRIEDMPERVRELLRELLERDANF